MKTYLVVTIGAALISIVATLIAIRAANALKILDSPGLRRVHRSPKPRLGGVAILTGMFVMTTSVFVLDNPISAALQHIQKQIFAALAGGAFMCLVGLVDDVRGIRARTKLSAQVFAGTAMYLCGIQIQEITLPGAFQIELGLLSLPATVLWIAAITNAINLIDGLDGLAAGIAAIACGAMAALAIITNQLVLAVLMLALLGSLLGFLVFNFNPARIFMGDSGSLFLGFVVATSSVLCTAKIATAVGLAIPFLALGVPISDMAFSMLRRVLERRSLFAPDSRHIHHRLLERGFSQPWAVLALYGLNLLIAALGLVMMATRNAETITVFVAAILILIGAFRLVGAIRLRESISILLRNWAIARESGEDRRHFEEAQLRLRHASSFDEWWQAVTAAASDLDFASLAMSIRSRDGSVRSVVWDRNGSGRPSLPQVQLSIPVADRRTGPPLSLEARIEAGGSVEAAGRRGALFTRLLDEYCLAKLPRWPREPAVAAQATTAAQPVAPRPHLPPRKVATAQHFQQ